MNKKEFEKKHPGLKEKWCLANHPYAAGYKPQYLYEHELIHETQLDKQKVKEAIDKVIPIDIFCAENMIMNNEFKKELGLD